MGVKGRHCSMARPGIGAHHLVRHILFDPPATTLTQAPRRAPSVLAPDPAPPFPTCVLAGGRPPLASRLRATCHRWWVPGATIPQSEPQLSIIHVSSRGRGQWIADRQSGSSERIVNHDATTHLAIPCEPRSCSTPGALPPTPAPPHSNSRHPPPSPPRALCHLPIPLTPPSPIPPPPVPLQFLERGLFVRERADGLYSPFTYLVAKLLDELMVNCLATLGISAFLFYGVQLQGNFGFFWVNYFVSVCVGITLVGTV